MDASKDPNRPNNVEPVNYMEQMKNKHGSYDKYYKGLEKFGIEESQVKHPDYPKVSDPPILRDNINRKILPVKKDISGTSINNFVKSSAVLIGKTLLKIQ
jgi:hypothetical protein